MKRTTIVALYAVLLCALATGTFLLLVKGFVSPTVFTLGLGAAWFALFLARDGVIIPDRNGNALIFTVRSKVRDLSDSVRWWHDQRQNTRKGRVYKKRLRQIVASLSAHGDSTVGTLSAHLDASPSEIAEMVRDLLARGWISESLPAERGAPTYVATERGLRDLANPGSTDHESA